MEKTRIGFAMCGSFCTFEPAMEQLHLLAEQGHKILPIMSKTASETDTRFGRASDFIWELEDTCQHKVIKTIAEAEPIGPKHLVDLMVVAPCTGNTLAKLSWGITDTPVTMAVKSSLRIGLPVVLALATNDALAASAQNLGRLLNVKNLYFVPLRQDNPEKKPTSLVCDFSQLIPACEAALQGKQLQPVLQG